METPSSEHVVDLPQTFRRFGIHGIEFGQIRIQLSRLSNLPLEPLRASLIPIRLPTSMPNRRDGFVLRPPRRQHPE